MNEKDQKFIKELNAKMKRGDGSFSLKNKMVYARTKHNGKEIYKSIKKELTPSTKAWISKRTPKEVLKYLYPEYFSSTRKQISIDITVKNYGESVLPILINKAKNEQYARDIENVFYKHIVTYFDDVLLEDITAYDIVHYLEYLKKELSGSRVKFIKNVFSNILDYAVDNKIIDQNPFNLKTVKNVEINTKPAKKKEAYTDEEMQLILENAEGWFKVFITLLFTTGARPGEIMALKWKDIDLDIGVIFLKRNIHKGVVYEKKDDSGTKNHYRTIFLMKDTHSLLQQFYNIKPHNVWVFVNRYKKPYSEPRNITEHYFKPLLAKLGIEYKTIYATRSTFISLMLNSDASLEAIQQTVGHKLGSRVTEEHYLDENVVDLQKRKEKMTKLEEAFSKNKKGIDLQASKIEDLLSVIDGLNDEDVENLFQKFLRLKAEKRWKK